MVETTERRRNWAPWLALLFAAVAVLSNAGFFVSLPGQGALVWVGVALAIAALVYAVVGIARAFRQPQGIYYGGKISSVILGVLSLLLSAFVGFALVTARTLPASAGAPHVGQKAPDFTLTDTHGIQLSLDELLGRAPGSLSQGSPPPPINSPYASSIRPKAVLLVFYRGWW